MNKRTFDLTEYTGDLSTGRMPVDNSGFTEIKYTNPVSLKNALASSSSTLTVASISGTDASSVTMTSNDGEWINETSFVRFSGKASFGSSGGDYDIQINLNQVYLGISGKKFPVDVYDGSGNYVRTVIGTIVGTTPIAFQVQTGSVQTFELRWAANLIKT